jgi:hypothetical protein
MPQQEDLSHYARGYGPREHGKIRGGRERYQPLMTYSGEMKQAFRDIYLLCIYSHRTATKHLGTLRLAPQFFEGFNLTYLASQIG